MIQTTKPPVAIYFDADNMSPSSFGHTIHYLRQLGYQSYYPFAVGAKQAQAAWQPICDQYGFSFHEVSAAKNAADIKIAMEVTKASLSNRFRVFCLVSSDGDFALIANEGTQLGAIMIGVGSQGVCTERLQSAFHHYHTIDCSKAVEHLHVSAVTPQTASAAAKKVAKKAVKKATKKAAAKKAVKKSTPVASEIITFDSELANRIAHLHAQERRAYLPKQALIKCIRHIFNLEKSKKNRVNLSCVGIALSKLSFKASDYGFSRLSDCVASLDAFTITQKNGMVFIS